jgi:hypothetical protein
MDENQKIIYDLLKEVRGDQKKDSKRIERVDTCVSEMQLQQKQMRNDIEDVKKETSTNTRHMGEHMARTEIAEQGLKLLTDLHMDNQKRIELLEADSKKKDEVIAHLKEKDKIEDAVAKTESSVKQKIKDNIKWIIGIGAGITTIVTKWLGLW